MNLFKSVVQILSIIMLVFFTNGNTQETNKAPTVVFVTGGDEYQSRERMKPFAEKLEKDYGFKVIYIADDAPGADTDPDHDPKPTVLPDADKIKDADLMVVFMRFRNWEPKSLQLPEALSFARHQKPQAQPVRH